MRKARRTKLLRPVIAAWVFSAWVGIAGAQVGISGLTCSSPIALTSDNRFVWVVNPNNNSVSVLDVGGDLNQKVREIRVGVEPQSVAITPDRTKVYVTNAVSGSVSIISTALNQQIKVLPVGTEPFGCALTPDGKKLYVANFGSDNVSVIDTTTDVVTKTIAGVGPKPRAIAIANGKVYVTLFLAQLRTGGQEGADDGKDGRVMVISATTDTVAGTVVLNPLANTGFNANGDALARIPPGAAFTFPTGAFPNLLQGISFKGSRAYVPNTASSPNGPVRFNVNVQSFLSVFNPTTDLDSGQTINMNSGVQFEPVGVRLFNTTPITMAFKRGAGATEGYVALGGTDRVLRVVVDANGTPTINPPADATQPSGIVRIPVGKNPRGIAINSTDTRAYVMNFISRDVSVVDIGDGSATKHTQLALIQSASLPAAGTQAAIIQRGHELFVSATGPPGTMANALPPAGRMSDFGWGACYNCHPNGLHDGVTWIFTDGPRRTISMHSTAEHPQSAGSQLNANGAPVLPAFKQRVLNWSAVRDEIQDFELNIRAVSGGEGLITDGLGVFNLTPTANTGRSANLDAIAAYISFGIRAPISPLRPRNVGGGLPDPEIAQGRALFAAANCQQCHGGPNWTRSRVNFTPPPDPSSIVNGQLIAFLTKVGTFDPAAFNEVRQNAAPPLGADGFNIPSLVSVGAGAPYFHNGSAPTLDDVLNNVTHRSAGTGGVDTLTNAADRSKVVKFLKSIDAMTPTFP